MRKFLRIPAAIAVSIFMSFGYAAQTYVPCESNAEPGDWYDGIAKGKVKTIDSVHHFLVNDKRVFRHYEYDIDGRLIRKTWNEINNTDSPTLSKERAFQYASNGRLISAQFKSPLSTKPMPYSQVVSAEVTVVPLPSGDTRVKRVLNSQWHDGRWDTPKVVEFIDRTLPLPEKGERHVCLEMGIRQDGNKILDFVPHGEYLVDVAVGGFTVPRLPTSDDDASKMLSKLPQQLPSMDPRVLSPWGQMRYRYDSTGYSDFSRDGKKEAEFDVFGAPIWSHYDRFSRKYSYKYDSEGNWVEQIQNTVVAATTSEKERREKAITKRKITYW